MKVFIFISLILFVSEGYSQGNQQNDVLETQCDGKVFTKCEEPPYLKNGAKSYQKLLTDYLSERNQLPTKGAGIFYLTVSKTGEVLNVYAKENSMTGIDSLIATIKSFRNEWNPGKQNKRIICAYVKIKIEVDSDKLKMHLNE